MIDTRYSKEQLLDLYKAQQSSEGGFKDALPNLYVGGWQPDTANGVGSASWGRTEQGRDTQSGPEICWDKEGSVEPLGLVEMDDEEREVCFAADYWDGICFDGAKSRVALCDICQHATQTAGEQQGESTVERTSWTQNLDLQPRQYSRRLWAPLTHVNAWTRPPPRYKRFLSISH